VRVEVTSLSYLIDIDLEAGRQRETGYFRNPQMSIGGEVLKVDCGPDLIILPKWLFIDLGP
jgi:hypothetical protein